MNYQKKEFEIRIIWSKVKLKCRKINPIDEEFIIKISANEPATAITRLFARIVSYRICEFI